MFKTRQDDFLDLRSRYGDFHYHGYEIVRDNGFIVLTFNFEITGLAGFHPQWVLPLNQEELSRHNNLFGKLFFHLGMVESISYWKLTCSPRFYIHTHGLSPEQQIWWKMLFFNGLGEFRYLNGIEINPDDFVEFNNCGPEDADTLPERVQFRGNRVIVPVGGGKDSAVTLQLLADLDVQRIPFMINPIRASVDTVDTAGLSGQELIFSRSLDPGMLRLNSEGFLNGHTPFSALVAFSSLIASVHEGAALIALSNESSANEDTIPGSGINHQYSKSYEFESSFHAYINNYLSPDFHYFSFLRPLSELAIAGIFTRMPQFHRVFLSCNAGSRKGVWCGECPKCLFAFVMLGAYMKPAELCAIFGSNLLNDLNLGGILDQLRGKVPVKPFECVGTLSEVNLALNEIVLKWPVEERLILKDDSGAKRLDEAWQTELEMKGPHLLPPEFENILTLHVDEILASKLDR